MLLFYGSRKWFSAIRNLLPEQEAELGGLLEGSEIPIRLKFVGWLVVVLRVVLLPHLLAVSRGLSGEFRGVLDGKGGDSHVGEGEMVGAEIVSLLRLAIGRNLQVEAARQSAAPAARTWSAPRP